jgi:hypothetical protein
MSRMPQIVFQSVAASGLAPRLKTRLAASPITSTFRVAVLQLFRRQERLSAGRDEAGYSVAPLQQW